MVIAISFSNVLVEASNPDIRYHGWWEQKAIHNLYFANTHDEKKHIYVIPNGRPIINAFAGINDYKTSDYIPNHSFIWHRVHCRNYQCCLQFSKTFFCSIMKNNTRDSISSSNDNDNTYPIIRNLKTYCQNIPQWIPPNETNHCREKRQKQPKAKT